MAEFQLFDLLTVPGRQNSSQKTKFGPQYFKKISIDTKNFQVSTIRMFLSLWKPNLFLKTKFLLQISKITSNNSKNASKTDSSRPVGRPIAKKTLKSDIIACFWRFVAWRMPIEASLGSFPERTTREIQLEASWSLPFTKNQSSLVLLVDFYDQRRIFEAFSIFF